MAFHALSRHWTVWKAAWQAESGQPLNQAVPAGLAAEFLPEALDIQQAPPSPIGRALLWTMVAAGAAGAAWAMLVKVDSVTTAQGKVVPSADSRQIHPSEAGVLAAIYVHDGQPVKQGDLLIDVDPTRRIAERDRAGKAHRAIRVEAARLRALIKNQATLEAPADADGDELRFQQQLLRDQLAEHQAKIAEAQLLVDQRRATIVETKDALLRLKTALSAETARADQSRKLMEHGVGAKTDFLQADRRRSEALQEVTRRQEQLEQDRAALAEAERESLSLVSDFQRMKQAELSALEAKAASLAQEAARAERDAGLQRVRSPIDGVVRQLTVQAAGSVVTPAQPVLMVAPTDHSVEVEAHVEKKDAEGLRKGRPVEIKLTPLPMGSAATIAGHVLTVADGAASNNSMERRVPITVSPDRSTVQVGSTAVTLTPGMAVTVEIKTEPRRMIEYLLAPVRRLMDDRVREGFALVQTAREFMERRSRS